MVQASSRGVRHMRSAPEKGACFGTCQIRDSRCSMLQQGTALGGQPLPEADGRRVLELRAWQSDGERASRRRR